MGGLNITSQGRLWVRLSSRCLVALRPWQYVSRQPPGHTVRLDRRCLDMFARWPTGDGNLGPPPSTDLPVALQAVYSRSTADLASAKAVKMHSIGQAGVRAHRPLSSRYVDT